jgi:hypothetical protein
MCGWALSRSPGHLHATASRGSHGLLVPCCVKSANKYAIMAPKCGWPSLSQQTSQPWTFSFAGTQDISTPCLHILSPGYGDETISSPVTASNGILLHEWDGISYHYMQIRSKDSQVKTQLVLWIFILFKVTRWLVTLTFWHRSFTFKF